MSILHVGFYILALRTVRCTSRGGTHLMGEMRCSNGRTTSSTSSGRGFVRLLFDSRHVTTGPCSDIRSAFLEFGKIQ